MIFGILRRISETKRSD